MTTTITNNLLNNVARTNAIIAMSNGASIPAPAWLVWLVGAMLVGLVAFVAWAVWDLWVR